jgi:hypothetical protein
MIMDTMPDKMMMAETAIAFHRSLMKSMRVS